MEREVKRRHFKVGDVVTAKVTQLCNYGAWVEWQGHNALVLIYDLPKATNGKPIRHPSEVVAVGQELKVKITNVEGPYARAVAE
jgi:ribosomal protein S1